MKVISYNVHFKENWPKRFLTGITHLLDHRCTEFNIAASVISQQLNEIRIVLVCPKHYMSSLLVACFHHALLKDLDTDLLSPLRSVAS